MQTNIKKDAIFLIDGSSILYRAYYAIQPLKTSKGIPVQAIYGFCRALKKIIDDFDPQNMVLVWDSRDKTFRSEIYEEYKQKRLAPPSDLSLQKQKILEFSELIGLKQEALKGLEADDLIASLAHKYSKKNHQVVIVSQDKDLRQLISDNVVVYDYLKKEIIDKESFITENEFEPEHTLLFYSLLGDESDNIPGVMGIGKKTAQELTIKYKTLENLYDHLDEIKKESLRNTLIEQKKEAFLSESLFRLKIIPMELSIEEINFNKANLEKAIPMFRELEFYSLLKDLEGTTKKSTTSKEELEALLAAKLETKGWTFKIIRTNDELDELIKKLEGKKVFAADTETSGLSPLVDDLVGLSFAYDKTHSYYIPLGHKNQAGEEKQLDLKETLLKLKHIWESESIQKTFHHTKFDQLVLWHSGIDVKGVCFDSLIAAYLLKSEDSQKIGLKFLSIKYFNEEMIAFSEITSKKYKSFAEVPIELGARYSAHDSLQTYKLKLELEKDLDKEPSLKKVFYDIEMPISQILFKIERFGVLIDPEIIKEITKKVNSALEIVESKILAAISIEHKDIKLNLNSPKQLEELLFNTLNLPVIKKSPTGSRSTDQEVLAELAKIHHVPAMIMKYRELFKLKSTYLEPLVLDINSNTKRIHTTYSQTEVITGRLSSSNPNMQNIPASSYGLEIRSAFIAPKDKILMSADYSQIELRVLAHFTKDKNLISAFKEDRDIHAQTAAQLFDVPIEKVTSEQRQIGKRINFSIIYGLTPFGLSKDLGIKPSEAKEYITKYFNQYPKVAIWMDGLIEQAKEQGYVETFFGRRRYVRGLHEKNRIIYEQTKRAAINTPVQGTSAEIMKLAMIAIDKMCTKHSLKTQMIIQIHDELVFELPEEEKDIAEKMVLSCMENIVRWEIPMKVSLRFGKNWAEITK